MNFAHVKSPQFDFLPGNWWMILSDQTTPEMIGIMHSNSKLLLNFRLDQTDCRGHRGPLDTRFFSFFDAILKGP